MTAMRKHILDLEVVSVESLSDKHVLVKLTHEHSLPEMLPGQFVEVRVDNSPTTFLRRSRGRRNACHSPFEAWRQAQLRIAFREWFHSS